MYKVKLSPYHKIFYNEWKLDQNSRKYNIVFDQTISNKLNIPQLKSSLNRFISDHLLLNSHIKETDSEYYWINNDNVRSLEQFDYCDSQIIYDYVSKPFNLENGPLYRFAIFNQDDGNFRFVIVLHHILIDGNCFNELITEISNYYNNSSYQSLQNLDEQIELITNTTNKLSFDLEQNHANNKKFWQDTLSDIEAVDLRFMRLNNNTELMPNTNIIEEIRFNFNEAMLIRLSNLKERYGISNFQLSQIIFAILLNRYTSQEQFAICYPVAIKECVQLIQGAGINTTTQSYTINSGTTLQELISQAKLLIAKIKENNYNYYPIAQILENNNTNLLDVFFIQSNLKDTRIDFNDVNVIQINHEFDIDLSGKLLFEQEVKNGALNYRVRYNKTGTDSIILNNFIKHYKKLFNDIVFDLEDNIANKPVTTYEILDTQEYQQIVYDWNKTEKPYPHNKTIHQLFEEQVEKTPDNIAVIYEDVKLTYRELNQKANQLAHYLRNNYQIQGDDLIALCLDRSEYMLITILAILKAGGAYVPIDPNYPSERIKYIISDTKLKAMISSKKYKAKISKITRYADLECKAIDSIIFQKILNRYSCKNLQININSHNLAYIIYTSGTTGQPKGVMLEHNGIVNRISWMNNTYPLNERDRILQKTPYTFDVSVWELFWASWYGASIVFSKPDGHKDPNYLIDLIVNYNITICHFIPSMLIIFLDTLEAIKIKENIKYIQLVHRLRNIFCSGEPLLLRQVQQSKLTLKSTLIVNLYGPTEASIDVSYYNCNTNKGVYIGMPIDNIKLYILNSDLLPVPIGAIGKLYISGVGIARGYLNKPELTTKQFIKNLFNKLVLSSYDKLYNTGDLVRYLPNGHIEYIGRNDFQVKIHGLRIELKEIEYAINKFTGIKQSIVKARNYGTPPSKHLLGYYLAEKKLDESKIIQYLKLQIPPYMIPSILIHMQEFPLTSHGKLDMAALPMPNFKANSPYIAPASNMEIKICTLFSKILNITIDKIGIYDSFLKLGGDSIQAIRLVGEMNKIFSTKLQIIDIYNYPNIAELGRLIIGSYNIKDHGEMKYEPFSLVDINDFYNIDLCTIEDIYPASYLQMGMFLESQSSDKSIYHDVFYYSIKHKFMKYKFMLIWNKLIAKHQLLRAQIKFDDKNGCNIFIFKKIKIKYTLFKEENLKKIIDNERFNKFNYQEAGLFKLIVNLYKDSFDLIFSFHHIIADGWSIASLINEFIQAYIYNKPIDIGAQAHLSYGEFIKNEQAALKNSSSLNFWHNYLECTEYKRIKWKFDNKTISTNGMFTASFELTKKETSVIYKISESNSIGIDTVFLYFYIKTLSLFLNSQDITIGLVVNNRLNKIGGDELFGLFLNTIPFTINIDKKSFNECLHEITTTKLRLLAFKNIPYGYIKSIFGNELYQFAFSFNHFHILKDSIEQISKIGGYEKTNIPFLLSIYQKLDIGFCIEFKVHDDFIDQDYLNYFTKYFKHILRVTLKDDQKNHTNINKMDYNKLIYKYNKLCVKSIDNSTVQCKFEEQVRKTPNNIALVCDDTQLSYHGLNQMANQLAGFLISHYNVHSDELILLCALRNEYLLIGMLAILKAGGAYVPIDSNYPKSKISQIIKNTNCRLILTSKKYINIFEQIIPEFSSTYKLHSNSPFNNKEPFLSNTIHIIDIEDPYVKTMNDFNPVNPLEKTKYNNLACVIFTSGTTNLPKGVMIEHKNIVSLVRNVKYIKILQNDCIAQFSDITFDAATFEIWGALLNGAKLCMPSNILKLYSDTDAFKKYNAYNQVSILWLTKTIFDQLYSQDNTIFKQLKYLLVGGEALNQRLISKLVNSDNKPNYILNGYGPTENTAFSCIFNITAASISNTYTVPIGQPMTNRYAYILGNTHIPVPIGVIGELYVGGIGLSRGYLNQELLTKEKFIANPFQTEEEKQLNINDKLFNTGDLARWLPNGNIEYIDRNDSQVKIRGYRIELNEIENVIVNHPKIKQAVVIVKEHFDNKTHMLDKFLVAYYVSSDKLDDQLLDRVTQELPEYMIPSLFVRLDHIPFTSNGKLNKSLLPVSDFISGNYIAPSNDFEIIVCKTYAKVLNLPLQEIGIHHDFFRLGGNSILAIRLTANLKDYFEIEINNIFELRTPYKIAQLNSSLIQNNLNHQLNQIKLIYNKLANYKQTDCNLMNVKINDYFKQIEQLELIQQAKKINNVLLTGSTGYLGCNILYKLLLCTDYIIYLPIRAVSDEEAYIRLKNKFLFYFDVNLEIYRNKMFIMAADITKANLKLVHAQYQQLILKIDTIVHCAAFVKHYGDYATFYKANVQATINLLELAKNTVTKDFHYISTIGIFMQGYVPNYSYYVFNENDNGHILVNRNNFYLQTKYEGEKTVIEYRKFGIKSNIYRVGNLSMNSQNYRNQENIEENAFFQRVKTILKLGIIPKELSMVEVSPVDYTALAVIKLLNQVNLNNQTYHVFNPNICNLYKLFTDYKDINVKVVLFDKFIDTILKHLKTGHNIEQLELFMLHLGWLQNINNVNDLTKIVILQDKTNYILSQLGFNWPRITNKMLYEIINLSKG